MDAPKPPVPLFGLLGFTHGAAKVLTVMSPRGARAALVAVAANDDVIVEASPGYLTRYAEKRQGGLRRLVEANGIELLSKADWDARKAEFGNAILQ